MLHYVLFMSLALALVAADGCSKDEECPNDQACVSNKCEDPCKDGCGLPNTACKVTNHRIFCSCLPGHYGVPTTGCSTGCSDNKECPMEQACVNHQCQDPCKDGCGVANTVCNTTNHLPFCFCLPGHYGDFTTGCTAGCGDDRECPNDQACVNHKCQDPCKIVCELPNTVCNVTNHLPFCSCLPGHHGSPTTGCTAGCSEDRECPIEQACANFKCVDPCKDGCGQPNTVCKVTNHRPFCSYRPHHDDDTHSGCEAGCIEDVECPKHEACINHKCQDPCKDGCGEPDTACKVTNHRPFCYHTPYHSDDSKTPCKGTQTTECKTAFTSGYDYNQFFPLYPNGNNGNNGHFILRFKVMTFTDAHVLLSTTPFPSDADHVIEIVIGGWANTQSVIRPSKQGPHISIKKTWHILSEDEKRGFWVKKYKDGRLEVGKQGSNKPFLEATDPHGVNYQYFSFSSWSSWTGTWLYDCTYNYTECDHH